jgi:uncharacterized protein (TIGR03435 family)
VEFVNRAFAGLVFFALLPGTVISQTAAASPDEAAGPTPVPPAFQIADVHPSPHSSDPELDGGLLYGDRYILHEATMIDLITAAYGLKPEEVLGGPSWLERDRFDIIAKAPPKTPPATLKLMLRALLAERFHLVLHNGTAPMPAYALSVGSAKPNLKVSDDTAPSDCHNDGPENNSAPGAVRNTRIACVNTTMEQFAGLLQTSRGYFDVPVVDSTGLKGGYDFKLTWTPRGQLVRAGADGISIFIAVEKQLGLKLTLETAPRPVTVVDSVDQRPTPNSPDLAKLLPPPPPAVFEVAVIKPSQPGSTDPNGSVNGGKVDLHNFTLQEIIDVAWEFDDEAPERIANAPKWLDKGRFDIVAKVADESLGSNAGKNDLRIPVEDLLQMLRALLIERFGMKVHMEDRPVDAYTLVAVNPKLRKADPTARTRCKQGPGPDGKDPRIANPVLNRLISCQNMTMAQLGEDFQNIASGYIRTPVFDETGLKGSYDFTLSFSGAGQVRPGSNGNDPSKSGEAANPNGALSLFDAVRQQLGLKLEKQKRQLPVLVIDQIGEKPTEN